MKKNILTTLASLGLVVAAQAADIDWAKGYNPLADMTQAGTSSQNGEIVAPPSADQKGWWIGGNAGDGANSGRFVHQNGVLTTTGTMGWNPSVAWYNLGQTYTLTQQHEALNFSITYTMKQPADFNSMFTVALVGTDKAIVMGSGFYNNSVGFGISDVANPTRGTGEDTFQMGYSFKAEENPNPKSQFVADTTSLGTTSINTSVTIDATIAWSESANQFQLSISMNGGETQTVDLGSEVDINRLTFTADHASYGELVNVSGMNLQITPEPTTATLSLLALAGLCARRRRK